MSDTMSYPLSQQEQLYNSEKERRVLQVIDDAAKVISDRKAAAPASAPLNQVWIYVWSNEAGDHGVEGYWPTKPTPKQLQQFTRERFPYDFENHTLYGELQTLPPLKAV